MSIKVVPTAWPIFEFRLGIWKLFIVTEFMTANNDAQAYEYARLSIYWSGKPIFHIRLFDTYVRMVDRMMQKQELKKVVPPPGAKVN